MAALNDREWLGRVMERERPRIVGLCAHLAGDRSVAEDLAQETFVEALRNLHKIHDANAVAPWLSAIARNVCLRWRSRRGRATVIPLEEDDANPAGAPMRQLAASDDLEVEIERSELAELLDQAISLLPPETRAILIGRYIADSPHADLAARLGMNTGAVKMRLSRGRLNLRRVLMEDLRLDAAGYGLVDRCNESWRVSSHWCPICGTRRLEGMFDSQAGDLELRCPTCFPQFGMYQSRISATPQLFDGITDLSDAYAHVVDTAGRYFRHACEAGVVECFHCGRTAHLIPSFPPGSPLSTVDWLGIHVHCHACGRSTSGSVSGMLLSAPELQPYWERHPQLRIKPPRTIDFDGRPAVAVRYRSMTDEDVRVVVIDRATFGILRIFDESPNHSHRDLGSGDHDMPPNEPLTR